MGTGGTGGRPKGPVGDISQIGRASATRWLMITLLRFFMMCGVLVLVVPSGASAQSCAAGPATLQILGSAGPAFNKDRASSSYLLWIDGKARMLVDMGGGAYLRFGQSG